MKRMILGLTLSLASIASHADWSEACEPMSNMAEFIMGERQKGISMSDAMKNTRETDNELIRIFTQDLVIRAYSKPRFDTEKSQEESIANFRDEIYLSCAKALRK